MDEPRVISRNPDGTPRALFHTSLEAFLNHDPFIPPDPLGAVVEVGDRPPTLPEVPAVLPDHQVEAIEQAKPRLTADQRAKIAMNRRPGGCGCGGRAK